MIARDPGPEPSEVWLLLATAYAASEGRGADPATIQLVSGILRQAGLVEEEPRERLERLEAAGLVREEAGRYRPAEPVEAWLRARAHRRGIWHDYEALLRLLGAALTSEARGQHEAAR